MSTSSDAISSSAPNQQPNRGIWRGRGRGRPWNRGRGGKNSSPNTNLGAGPSTEDAPVNQKTKTPRPTHFLALPLNNHVDLSSRVVTFHRALLDTGGLPPDSKTIYTSRGKPHLSRLVQGLDSTILIDPIRMHMTLGVMALESEEPSQIEQSSMVAGSDETVSVHLPRKTVTTALELLKDLQPRITEILDGDKSVYVPLDHLDVLKTERLRPKKPSTGNVQEPTNLGTVDGSPASENTVTPNVTEDTPEKIGAGVLFLGPSANYDREDRGRKLKEICELVHKTFKDANYLTDTRPLKLHCTILNASHRKPKSRLPFSYSDIAKQPACQLLITNMPSSTEPALYVPASISRQATAVPIQLGSYPVSSIQLWRMGSHGPNNEYVNCGGIDL